MDDVKYNNMSDSGKHQQCVFRYSSTRPSLDNVSCNVMRDTTTLQTDTARTQCRQDNTDAKYKRKCRDLFIFPERPNTKKQIRCATKRVAAAREKGERPIKLFLKRCRRLEGNKGRRRKENYACSKVDVE